MSEVQGQGGERIEIKQIQWVEPSDMVSSNVVARAIIKMSHGELEAAWQVQYLSGLGSSVNVFLSNPFNGKREKEQWLVDREPVYFFELAQEAALGWMLSVKGAREELGKEGGDLGEVLFAAPGVLVSPERAVVIEKVLRRISRVIRADCFTEAAKAVYFLCKWKDAQKGLEWEMERMYARGNHPLFGAGQVEYWQNRVNPIKRRMEDSEWRVVHALGNKDVLAIVLNHPDREIRMGAIMLAGRARDMAEAGIIKI